MKAAMAMAAMAASLMSVGGRDLTRRSFARSGIDVDGVRVSIRQPQSHVLIPPGLADVIVDLQIPPLSNLSASCASCSPALNVRLYVDSEHVSTLHGSSLHVDEKKGSSSSAFYSFHVQIHVLPGVRGINAVLSGSDGSERAMAHAMFLVRDPSLELFEAARDVCANSSRAASLGIRSMTSPCDALVQLGHELRVRHVYPYLEHAKACMQTGAAEEAIRTLQLIHRLQPGYEVLTPKTRTRHCQKGCELIVDAEGNPGGHYRLLSYMASLLQDALIVELGTMHGGSAIALAAGSRKNRVVTYNIVDDLTPNMRACGMRPDAFLAALEEENLSIEWRFENVLGSEERMRELLEASLIHIDINHHGDIEDAILQAGES
ncbi:hypothetical protein GUITHDRAFT_108718 [Guillardia theta CCMP2712]|uniref:Uncharacterized protein n=1 Tax=Guillardia theta (strain CCMP2712) TaxID=905079 RepID=L1JBF7_GUITC|nr:hypothetical protein GUITHDRAFT_108718 [Guillardia theta CCMP2712]EKX45454.1 hypothetical protein GUITHDRAFT_108718 [Guillardia theta CCMP2712]|eukprot:XP_005832434.1 hypothetical protein GUITHDRAFT_108718 [Guillardia theta CCMP2712]